MTSIKEEFEYKVIFSNRPKELLYWLIAAVIGISMFYYLIEDPVYAIIIIGVFFIGGSAIGYLWYIFGKKMSYLLIINPLNETVLHDKKPKFYLKYLIGTNVDEVFLQLKTNNRELDGIKKIARESFRIVVAFTSILVTVARIFTQYLNVDPVNAMFIGFFSSTIILTFFIPFSLIVEDSRIMIENENGTIKLAGGTVRNFLEGFLGITGIISGYQIFVEYYGSVIAAIAVYPVFLVIFLIMAIPLLFPTLFVYYHKHEQLVKNVREASLLSNIYPATTEAKRLNATEIQELVFDEILYQKEDRNLLNKVRSFFQETKTREYTSEQRSRISQLGGWICSNCDFPNSSTSTPICIDCGNSFS